MQTRMNANSVPMFVRSTISSMLVNIAQTPTTTPVRIVVTCGVRNRGCTLREARRQQAVARHREEDARLAELEDQQHRRVRDDRAERDDADEQVAPASDVRVLQRHRQRLGLLGRELLHEHVVRNDAGEDRGDDDVDDRADDERADDADRQVALRDSRLLGDGRDRVEADVGEEDDRRARPERPPSRSARTGASSSACT